MTAPDVVLDLVARFREQRQSYLSPAYNETQLRREFLDPLFEALGWDMHNRQGHAESYKEVIHEDALRVEDSARAPDYAFRVGGTRAFLVEAKKPAVNLKDDPSPAFQLRRYAWSAGLPLSILTDFQEFIVYDCRVKPDHRDRASTARILYLTCDDYQARWEEIAGVFSKEAVLKGAFDRYAAVGRKRGTQGVDAAFLGEIEGWRESLARNLALRNPDLTVDELNMAVGRIIDRIIFLRIAEDRGIEEYGRLQALQNGPGIYGRLRELFARADERYNSGLFHFRIERGRAEHPDTLSPRLAVDDKPLKEIIRHLYYPDSPYEFSALPADILGQVYEQFLGKVIRLTAGHQAKVEEKPEVKKAGGVFYTPTWVVEYIVGNTVGRLLEGKTPKGAAKLRILDPACGSGSFLIGAYQRLLDWHRDWYAAHDPEKLAAGKNPVIHRAANGEWRLTTAERKRILTNTIYGVDIDRQAVEVTKLSLLLKVLEGESGETISRQLRFFHERALPDLADNVKCGNSLIGPDFFDGRLEATDEERTRVNPFDWQAEFPGVMAAGGFDVVIGNPPYSYQISSIEQVYFCQQYQHQDYQKDLYLLFLERYERLLIGEGLLGVIVSNTWLQSLKLRRIRQYLSSSYLWLNILHLPEKVFKAVVDTHVLIFQKMGTTPTASEEVGIFTWKDGEAVHRQDLAWKDIPKNGDPINIVASSQAQALKKRIMKSSTSLSSICSIYNGVKPFEKGKGTPPQTDQIMKEKPFVREGAKPGSNWSPLLRGSLIRRYQILWDNDYWIQYGPWLAAPRDSSIFEAPLKIMVRQTGDSIVATLVDAGLIARNNLHILLPESANDNLPYLLGILNSRFMDFIYTLMNPEKGEALAEVKKEHVEQLPIRVIDFSKPEDRRRHDEMVALVERMLDLHRRLPQAHEHDRTLIERQIRDTDRRIDLLVYDLYALTPADISLLEGGM